MSRALTELTERWRDNPTKHAELYQFCHEQAAADPVLFQHRAYVAGHALGFGAMGLHWVWKVLVEAVSSPIRFLEIGVYRGQILSLVSLLAPSCQTGAGRLVGVSPFDGRGLYAEGGTWTLPDPFRCQDHQLLTGLFAYFGLPRPTLIFGDSTDLRSVGWARAASPAYDIVYIDGSHEYGDVLKDLKNYSPLIAPGGFLVMDDSACGFQMAGMFAGFPGPSEVADAALPPFGGDTLPGAGGKGFTRWQFLFNVSHLRVWQRTV